MTDDDQKLVGQLRDAGISRAAIRAAWPSWWTDEAATSPSGRAELRFALARRLGLRPKALLGERVEFVWNDEARFKHLTTQGVQERAAITSFGISVARLLLKASGEHDNQLDAETLRNAILGGSRYVDLSSLIGTCWALGIPVIYLRVFPLEAKRMHAMVVSVDGRFAVLLGRDSSYPAPVAFTLAHELGHIMLGHLADTPAIVDFEDPATARHRDEEEAEADRFALTLLTGSPSPDIRTSLDRFNAPTLAAAALDAATRYAVEPGTLALCLGYRRNAWAVAMASLKFIYSSRKPAWREVNGIADRQIAWDKISDEAADFLRHVMVGND